MFAPEEANRCRLDYLVNTSDMACIHSLAGRGIVSLHDDHWMVKAFPHRCSRGSDNNLNTIIGFVEWMFMPALTVDASVSQLDLAWTIRLSIFSRLLTELNSKGLLAWQSSVDEYSTLKAFSFALSHNWDK